jgi:hypothetical protein
MLNARWLSIVQVGALIVLWLLAGVFLVEGLLGSVFRWVLHARVRTPPLYPVITTITCFIAVLIGAGVIARFRIAAIVLSVGFALLCGLEIYDMIYGFVFPRPPHFSYFEIAGVSGLGFLPALLTALAWRRLR